MYQFISNPIKQNSADDITHYIIRGVNNTAIDYLKEYYKAMNNFADSEKDIYGIYIDHLGNVGRGLWDKPEEVEKSVELFKQKYLYQTYDAILMNPADLEWLISENRSIRTLGLNKLFNFTL